MLTCYFVQEGKDTEKDTEESKNTTDVERDRQRHSDRQTSIKFKETEK